MQVHETGIFVGSMLAVSTAAGQHRHPPQDEALHEKFYSTWYMPDNPSKSCCNKADCYPTEVKYRRRQRLRPAQGGREIHSGPASKGGA